MPTPAPGKMELNMGAQIVTNHLVDEAVSTEKIEDDAVTAEKMDVSLSAEITSTASAVATAHGLSASPSVYFAILTETATSANPNVSATADATNVYVTAASTDVKYKIFALV